MSGRTFVLIFFFWAVLIIVTPTLILLSESSKPEMGFKVKKSGAKLRKVMDYTHKLLRAEAPVQAPTPASTPETVILQIAKGHLRRFLR
ncbi:hypothetical protein K2173_027888 [Erythroxylum novogranatense]|uniref:Uncharacterized protein n=1 Tax=Erythroxylum novogranatense TaxID=1862640 RepID=A0AAV8U1M4_9ROSI|nr:hypothetical protein K2173_027888 [Erythroxylum novogranatense]